MMTLASWHQPKIPADIQFNRELISNLVTSLGLEHSVVYWIKAVRWPTNGANVLLISFY